MNLWEHKKYRRSRIAARNLLKRYQPFAFQQYRNISLNFYDCFLIQLLRILTKELSNEQTFRLLYEIRPANSGLEPEDVYLHRRLAPAFIIAAFPAFDKFIPCKGIKYILGRGLTGIIRTIRHSPQVHICRLPAIRGEGLGQDPSF